MAKPRQRSSARLDKQWMTDPVGAWSNIAARRARAKARVNGKDSDVTSAAVRQWYSQQGGLCFYCGVEMTIERGHYQNGEQPDRISVDRVDSSLQYKRSNCVLCCVRCNILKSSHDRATLEMMLDGLDRIRRWGVNRARVEVGKKSPREASPPEAKRDDEVS